MVPVVPRLGLVLTLITLAAFFGFVILAGVSPATLAQPVIGTVPLSFIITTCLIIGTVLLTALYVLLSNRKEDAR